jgi:hypothetical protein
VSVMLLMSRNTFGWDPKTWRLNFHQASRIRDLIFSVSVMHTSLTGFYTPWLHPFQVRPCNGLRLCLHNLVPLIPYIHRSQCPHDFFIYLPRPLPTHINSLRSPIRYHQSNKSQIQTFQYCRRAGILPLNLRTSPWPSENFDIKMRIIKFHPRKV